MKGMHIGVFGAGVSGIGAAEVLIGQGAKVTLFDESDDKASQKRLEELGLDMELALGKAAVVRLRTMDKVVLSPGISIYHPEIEAAKAAGVEVMSEVELAYRLTQAKIIAITGTNGKTTTTTLVGEIMGQMPVKVAVGGNIGQALSKEGLSVGVGDWLVAEISSFQLEGVLTFCPHIAAILNITPDHIDRHKTFDGYVAVKEEVFHRQQDNDFLVLNYDDEIVRNMAVKSQAQVFFFSRKEKLAKGFYVEDGWMVAKLANEYKKIAPVSELQIIGGHNVENALAAIACTYLAGVPETIIRQTLAAFSGVEHRIELVKKINGVPYYNDSKATNPESTIKALEAFDGGILLLAGGHDKMTDLSVMMGLVKERTDALILFGEAEARFAEAAQAAGVRNIHRCGMDFEAAVQLAHKLAKPQQIVLLSPACSSYDLFDNYEQRGRVFKELVRALELTGKR